MPRTRRLLLEQRPTVYHVMSRTALNGFPLDAADKDYFLELLRRCIRRYFVELLGFCVMDNHFHLLVRMLPESEISDKEVILRYKETYGSEPESPGVQLPVLRRQWGGLSYLMRELKMEFSRHFNRKNRRRGYFWGGRFKSVIVESGRALLQCLAYIDLNPIRAGLVQRPEDYRWCSMSYLARRNNAGGLLTPDFGLADWSAPDGGEAPLRERLRRYRAFLYELGVLESPRGGARLNETLVARARANDYADTLAERLLTRCRAFSDAAVMGSSGFVQRVAGLLRLQAPGRDSPRALSGQDGIFALHRPLRV